MCRVYTTGACVRLLPVQLHRSYFAYIPEAPHLNLDLNHIKVLDGYEMD